MRIILCLLMAVLFITLPNSVEAKSPKKGKWLAKLTLNPTTELPFRLIVKNKRSLSIYNGEERIDLKKVGKIKDTIVYEFPDFHSQLYIVWKSKKTFTGYWWNKNKPGRYTVPLNGTLSSENLFAEKSENSNAMLLAKKYKVLFSYKDGGAFPAIGLFQQENKNLQGTFLTETGDYRFLSGNVYGNEIQLSCFDGSHAFLFTASKIGDSLKGKFYSATTYMTDWYAVADSNYELTDPYDLTYLKEKKPFSFALNDLDGKLFTYPNAASQSKMTIVQIMGSWCPNCMDETKYYLDLYKEYNNKGLEIILVGFEYGNTEEEYRERLIQLKNRYKIPFKILIGGKAVKQISSEVFPMLNEIISYPTSVFLDEKGNVLKIHTGFAGPGTGDYYTQYTTEMKLFIETTLGL